MIYCRGSAVSVACISLRSLLTNFFHFCAYIDNKLYLASPNFPLMSLRDRDRFSTHSVYLFFFRLRRTLIIGPTSTGFEYFADPNARSDGYITWQMDGSPTVRMGAGAVAPDQGSDGSGVGQRLIPEEPMVTYTPITFPYSCLMVVCC